MEIAYKETIIKAKTPVEAKKLGKSRKFKIRPGKFIFLTIN